MADDRLHQSPPDANPDDPIVPIEFTPVGQAARGFRLKLSPVRVAIGLVLLLFGGAAVFVLSARSVFLDVRPLTSQVNVDKALAVKIGPRYLVMSGELPVSIIAEGYYDLDTTLTVTDQQAQTFIIDMQPLPGILNLTTPGLTDARVIVDGEERGLTPLMDLELAAGEHLLSVEKDRYEPFADTLTIEGRTIRQSMEVELLPAWAEVTLTTQPAGATVSVDGVEVGTTPLVAEILEGEHEVLLKLPQHKIWTDRISVLARENFALPMVELEQADGLVLLQSEPSNANVTLDGIFQGRTPLEVTVTPGTRHEVTFFLNGYEGATRTFTTSPEQETSLRVTLDPILSSVEISAVPADAELYVNGEFRGNANQTIELLAASQAIEIRREGYVTYETTFISRPGLDQKLDVTLKSLEQLRIESIKPVITTVNGQSLKLLYPASFIMGASRREAGRQANEVLRNVTLTRPYYLSLNEVTNAQFAAFDAEHSSGVVEGRTLSNNNQPVVRVTWDQAARYCNWLSEQEDLAPFYTVEGDKVTGFNAQSLGYRLPTEAEWAWAARVSGDPTSLLKFPWGDQLPPPDQHGNYADISAGVFLGRIIANYNDGYLGSAPVGSFPPNANGFYDMGGNVAEWVHDYYGATGQIGQAEEVDPLGPMQGTYHVIRGSSWAHGTVTELRLSYRDYNNESRDDVGFRVARYLEP